MELLQEMTEFLAYARETKKLDALTIKAYSIDLRQFADFVRANVADASEITKADILAYVRRISEKYAPKSLKRKLASLKVFFRYLEFNDRIPVSPFQKVRIPIKERKMLPRSLNFQEMRLLYRALYGAVRPTAVEIRNRAVFELMFATGMRVSELCHLKLSDYSISEQTVRIRGKGGKERLMYLGHPAVLQAMTAYLNLRTADASEDLFLNRRRARLSEQSVRFFLKKLSRSVLGKTVTPHMIRHTFATLLLEEGVDIRYIQTFLGHSSILTTQIYTHSSVAKQRQILTQSHPRNVMFDEIDRCGTRSPIL